MQVKELCARTIQIHAAGQWGRFATSHQHGQGCIDNTEERSDAAVCAGAWILDERTKAEVLAAILGIFLARLLLRTAHLESSPDR